MDCGLGTTMTRARRPGGLHDRAGAPADDSPGRVHRAHVQAEDGKCLTRRAAQSDRSAVACLRRHAFREEVARAWEPRCVSVNSASPGALWGSFFLGELVHALMRQPQETSRIARAHLQFPGSQYADGASSRAGRAPVFFVGLPAKSRVGPNRPCRGTSAASRRPRWGPCGRHRRTIPAPPGCGAEPRRRCAPACDSRAHRARWPPTSPTRLARRPRDRTSRLLQPSLSEARLQVALDAAQQTRPDVFTRMNRHSRHTLAAFDA